MQLRTPISFLLTSLLAGCVSTGVGAGANGSVGASPAPGSSTGGQVVASGAYKLVVDGVAVPLKQDVTDVTRGAIPTMRGLQFGPSIGEFAGSGGELAMVTVQLIGASGVNFTDATIAREAIARATITLAGGPGKGKTLTETVESLKDTSSDVFSATKANGSWTIHFNGPLAADGTANTQFDAVVDASKL